MNIGDGDDGDGDGATTQKINKKISWITLNHIVLLHRIEYESVRANTIHWLKSSERDKKKTDEQNREEEEEDGIRISKSYGW